MTREPVSPSADNQKETDDARLQDGQRDQNAPAGESGQDYSAERDTILAENADLRDRLLRAVAETENLRKRAEREQKDVRTYAIAGFARDMLTATDNLNRALAILPDGFRDTADDQVKALIEGIDMTGREMTRLLEKNGITPIAAEGERFDPHRHQAMFEIPNTEVPEGTVLQVVQTGYAIGERVLRPAMVGVSKGGPKRGAEKPHRETYDNAPADRVAARDRPLADASGRDQAGTEPPRIDKEA